MTGRPLQRLLCEALNRTLREWINDSLQMGGAAALCDLRRCRFHASLERRVETALVPLCSKSV